MAWYQRRRGGYSSTGNTCKESGSLECNCAGAHLGIQVLCIYMTLGNSQHPILCEKTSCRTTWFIPMCTSQTYSCSRHLHVEMGHNSVSSYDSECACMDHDNRNNVQTRGLCI